MRGDPPEGQGPPPSFSTMNTLVTGGSGCIGSYVMRDLLARGETVVNYDFDLSDAIPRQVIAPDVLRRVAGVRADISDAHQFLRTVKEHTIKRIVHLAALQIPASQANPPAAVRVNVEGLVNVLEAARVFDIESIVWASSVAVFGPPSAYPGGIAANDAPHRPVSVYGACKSLGEQLLAHYRTDYSVNATGLRFTAVYGVGRERGKSSFTTEMIRKVAAGEPYEVPFADDTIDWQYVEDVSRLVLMALDAKNLPTQVFNTQGDVRPVTAAVSYLKQLAPDARLTISPGTFGITWKCDTTPLRQELGFAPQFSMEQGIRRTFNLYRQALGKPTVEGS